MPLFNDLFRVDPLRRLSFRLFSPAADRGERPLAAPTPGTNGGQPSPRPEPASRAGGSWAAGPKRVVASSVRPVIAWMVVFVLMAPQLISVAPSREAPALSPAAPHSQPAGIGDGETASATATPPAPRGLERVASGVGRAPDARSARLAFWTTIRGGESPSASEESVFKSPAQVPRTAGLPSFVDDWTAPQWAEPERDATAHLALLQYLPAQLPAVGRVSSFFGPRRVPHGGIAGRLRFHAGIDIAVLEGTPVVAPGPGIVVGTGYGQRFGTYVRIWHEQVGLETLLAHLSSVERGIRRGARVERGQVVGQSGNSGWTTGPHLHFEFRTVREQRPVDPLQVYALYARALDHVADFPIASVHAQLPPYRIEGPLILRH